ncbi:MAG TPA: hypothetical protein VEV16_07115 [Daejeonella sp.]|nr:hypothetical protein [Daejeonella sp.]
MKLFIITFLMFIGFKNSYGQKLLVDYSQMSKEEQLVTKLELRTLEWSRLHQLDSLAFILPDDYVGIFSSTGDKKYSKKDALSFSNDFVLRSYEVFNVVANSIKPDVIVVTYHMIQDGENGDGAKWPKKISSTATYVKRYGKWFVKFYTEAIMEN